MERILNPPLSLPAGAIEDEPSATKREEMKTITATNFIDFWTRLEVLLGLKLSGHTNTQTEASSLLDEVLKKVEIQNEQQYRNALDKIKRSDEL